MDSDGSDYEAEPDDQGGEAGKHTTYPEGACLPPQNMMGQPGPSNSENETSNQEKDVPEESLNDNNPPEMLDEKPRCSAGFQDKELPTGSSKYPPSNDGGIGRPTTAQSAEELGQADRADQDTYSPYISSVLRRESLERGTDEHEAGNQWMMGQRDEVPNLDRRNEQSLPVQWNKVVPIAVAMAVVAIVSYYFVAESWPDGPLSSPREHLVSDFMGRLEELRERFPSQSNRFWRKVEVSTRRVMGDQNPLQPATFLMPVSDENLATTTCLLEHLSEAITASYQAKPVIDINLTTMVNEDSPDVVKRSIDHTLLNKLESGSKVSVIHHLEKIPLSAALIFQGYCDNENARFKDSVFFYTVYLSAQPVPEDDASIQKKMGEMWSADPTTQGYMPLMARIVKNIVYVRPEDSGILKRECSIKV